MQDPAGLAAARHKSAINVLIQGEGAPFGVLEVDSRRLDRFTRGDADFLQSCANLVASAIDRLHAEKKLEQAAKEKELLLHELQHRVKNSLQEIAALVHAQRRTLSGPEARRLSRSSEAAWRHSASSTANSTSPITTPK